MTQPRRPPRLPTRTRTGRPSERGSVTVQMVILLPVVFAFMFMALQSALWYHARAVALGAAQEGARVASADGSTGPAGAAAATDFVADAGGDGVLLGSGVNATRGATVATVTVTGNAHTVIPGWAPAIHQSASVPVERLTSSPSKFTIPETPASDLEAQRWV